MSWRVWSKAYWIRLIKLKLTVNVSFFVLQVELESK